MGKRGGGDSFLQGLKISQGPSLLIECVDLDGVVSHPLKKHTFLSKPKDCRLV